MHLANRSSARAVFPRSFTSCSLKQTTSFLGGFFDDRPCIAVSEVFSYFPGRRLGACARTVSENVVATTDASIRPEGVRRITRPACAVLICPPASHNRFGCKHW